MSTPEDHSPMLCDDDADGNRCAICNESAGRWFTVREMMFGLRTAFRYFQCERCGCLALKTPPDDLSAYYPNDQYYAFAEIARTPTVGSLRRWVKRRRDTALLFHQGGFWSRVAERFPNPGIADLARIFRRKISPQLDMRILDVGCRDGHHLQRLAALGFTDLTGIDPYVVDPPEISGIRFESTSIDSLVAEPFDLIMLHHAFEHMPDPRETLRQLAARLHPRGLLYIRIPIISEGPWRRFGCDWAEIDAPRHFFLHSVDSLQRLCEAANLRVIQTDFEAELFTYAASTLYQRDVPLRATAGAPPDDWQRHFSEAELNALAQQAQDDLAAGNAGRAAFSIQHRDAPA